ncbi:MAG: energy-coupling factor ABC transporter permease [Deltaproteobacteria bacterium]|nr:energy-coupling factor ABC transporter permease [Deltaproteobacteria bacterium]
MHMADALLSPAVGITMWGVTAGTIAYCSTKIKKDLDDRKIPLMGVLGAFIFAAQMINFTIPATGSSGHIGGGLLLAILLGPHAAFLTIASVLVIQALFFADGGILALGCNIFNMGIFPAFIAYPLIYKKIIGHQPSPTRLSIASIIGVIVALQLGAFSVVLETVASGISALPFTTFVILMQPIHLAIGFVEGLVTATVVSFVYTARPEIPQSAMETRPLGNISVRNIVLAFLTLTFLTGGVLSWYASENPDGLEWSIAKVTGAGEVTGTEQSLHHVLAAIQGKTAFLANYSFPSKQGEKAATEVATAGKEGQDTSGRLGTSVSGGVGSLLTLTMVVLIGFFLRRKKSCKGAEG